MQPTATAKNSMSPEDEKAILNDITKNCKSWYKLAITYNIIIIVLGICALSTSVLVSIYTGSEKTMDADVLKILACISTISLGLLTAFNLVNKSSDSLSAWRTLHTSLMLYRAKEITIVELIEQYNKGENKRGSIQFRYGASNQTDDTAIDRKRIFAEREYELLNGNGNLHEQLVGKDVLINMQKERKDSTERIVTTIEASQTAHHIEQAKDTTIAESKKEKETTVKE